MPPWPILGGNRCLIPMLGTAEPGVLSPLWVPMGLWRQVSHCCPMLGTAEPGVLSPLWVPMGLWRQASHCCLFLSNRNVPPYFTLENDQQAYIKCLLCAELQRHRVAASQALSQNSLETDQWTVADTGLGMGGNPRGWGHFRQSQQ